MDICVIFDNNSITILFQRQKRQPQLRDYRFFIFSKKRKNSNLALLRKVMLLLLQGEGLE